LLTKDIRKDIKDNVFIKRACTQNAINIFNYLLSFPEIDPSIQDNYCLKRCIENYKCDKIIDILLNNSEVKNKINNDLMKEAYLMNRENIIKKLYNNVNPNIHIKAGILHNYIINSKDFNTLKKVLSNNTIINDSEIYQLAVYLCYIGELESLKILLD